MVDLDAFRETVRAASAALEAAIGHDPATPVPSCPDWDLAELIRHVGVFQRWATGNLATGERFRIREVEQPGEDRAAWFEAGAAGLHAALEAVDPQQRVWTWAGEQPAMWWIRRAAHEIWMHAWDATNAIGAAPPPLQAEVAADGIDEYLHLFVPTFLDQGDWRGDGETLHLHTTDADGEWHVTLGPGAPTVTREHRKGDVASKGRARTMLLALWGRVSLDELEWFGEDAEVARWRRRIEGFSI